MKFLNLMSLFLVLFLLTACASAPQETVSATAAPTETPTETTAQWPEPDKLIALTFDDGPSTKTMVQVLDVLKEYDAKGTFFVIGNKINASTMDVMQRAIDEGHEIGNHSFNHLHMAELTEEEILWEYEECQKIVKEKFGLDMYFFRAPYSSIDDRMYRLIDAPFMGGISTGDGTIGSIAADRAWKATSNAYDGAIIVMHCFQGNDETVEALKLVLPELKAQGYKFVTLTQLYEETGYELPAPHTGTKLKDNKPLE